MGFRVNKKAEIPVRYSTYYFIMTNIRLNNMHVRNILKGYIFLIGFYLCLRWKMNSQVPIYYYLADRQKINYIVKLLFLHNEY